MKKMLSKIVKKHSKIPKRANLKFNRTLPIPTSINLSNSWNLKEKENWKKQHTDLEFETSRSH